LTPWWYRVMSPIQLESVLVYISVRAHRTYCQVL